MNADRTIALAAGGTGGHLFPAQALADALHRRGYHTVLIGDLRVRAFVEHFAASSIEIVAAATPSTRSPLAFIKACGVLAQGFFRSRQILRRHRPAAIVGFGGYPSVAPVLAARTLKIPAIIHEQNAVLGRANGLLARFAERVALGMPAAGDTTPHHAVVTGNPVRAPVLEAAAIPYGDAALRRKDAPFNLVVFGGSQGAHVFSTLIPKALGALAAPLRARIALTMQCRAEDLEATRAALSALDMPIEAELAAFFDDMPTRLAHAHLVIARAGASSVAELAVIGRPAVLVPFPHALDHDQRANAQGLQNAGGGWIMEQKDLRPQDLAAHLDALMGAPDRLIEAAACAGRMGDREAADKLAELVEELERVRS